MLAPMTQQAQEQVNHLIKAVADEFSGGAEAVPPKARAEMALAMAVVAIAARLDDDAQKATMRHQEYLRELSRLASNAGAHPTTSTDAWHSHKLVKLQQRKNRKESLKKFLHKAVDTF